MARTIINVVVGVILVVLGIALVCNGVINTENGKYVLGAAAVGICYIEMGKEAKKVTKAQA